MSKVHIGKKIKEVWKRTGMRGTVFASLINRDRQVIYDIFKRESIDTEQLQKISSVLKHDFFSYYIKDPLITKDPADKFGYATKEELAQSNKEVINFMKIEFGKLREELSLKKEVYRLKNKSRKTTKK